MWFGVICWAKLDRVQMLRCCWVWVTTRDLPELKSSNQVTQLPLQQSHSESSNKYPIKRYMKKFRYNFFHEVYISGFIMFVLLCKAVKSIGLFILLYGYNWHFDIGLVSPNMMMDLRWILSSRCCSCKLHFMQLCY